MKKLLTAALVAASLLVPGVIQVKAATPSPDGGHWRIRPATIYNFIYNFQTPTLIGHDPNNGTASTYNQWCNQGAPTVTGYLYDNNNGYMLSTVNFPVYAYQCEQQYAYWTSGLGAGVSYSWWFCGYGNPGPTYCTAKLTWTQ